MFRLFYAVRANLRSIGTKLRENIACLFVVSSNRRRATPPILPPTLSEHRTGPEPRPTAPEPPQQILQTSAPPSTYIPPHLRTKRQILFLQATQHSISWIAREYHEASRQFAGLLIQAAEECWDISRHGWWPVPADDNHRIQPLSVYLQLARVVSQYNAGALTAQMEHAVTAEILGRRAAHVYYETRGDLTEEHPGGHEHCIEVIEQTKVILFGRQAGH